MSLGFIPAFSVGVLNRILHLSQHIQHYIFFFSYLFFCCVNWPNIVILSFTSSMLAEFFSTIFPITSFTSHLYTNVSLHGERIHGLKLIRKKKLLLEIKAPRSMYQYLFAIYCKGIIFHHLKRMVVVARVQDEFFSFAKVCWDSIV